MADFTLADLLPALPSGRLCGDARVGIRDIVADSRRVRPGDVFVAIRGLTVDGHDYIPQAIEKGAAAIVAERELKELEELREPGKRSTYALVPPVPSVPRVPCVFVPNSLQALAHLCAARHGYPARRLRVIGVTGTDGKTTTATLIRAVLEAAGHKTGLISTVAAFIGDERLDTGFHTTTPDAPDVQRYLAQMVAASAEYAVIEATSHGLAQYRVDACEFDVAVITNITHEHLDYHGSHEAYRAAKARLFESLVTAHRKPGTPKVSILNADDRSFPFLSPIAADVRLTYGLTGTADVRASDMCITPSGLSIRVQIPAVEFAIGSALVGLFNVSNILAAVAVGISQDLPIEVIQQGIASVSGIVGRMERIDAGQDFAVIVDFAHTPNALERALETARQLTQGRVIVVFGCAGRRDWEKRPLMGEIAGRLADRVIITAEDPRTEDLDAINAAIAAGCERAGRREGCDYWRINDRAQAIAFAVDMARAGDLVIVTGKGHEQTICFGETEYPWSDHLALRAALEQRRLRV